MSDKVEMYILFVGSMILFTLGDSLFSVVWIIISVAALVFWWLEVKREKDIFELDLKREKLIFQSFSALYEKIDQLERKQDGTKKRTKKRQLRS